MTRRHFLAASATAAAQSRQPANIVFILMDDLGWAATGSYGQKTVPTPNLDRLAAQGIRFTNAYATPQCTPTRATLMTGQYTARNRMWHVIPAYGLHNAKMAEPRFRDQFPREDFTLAKGLKSAGYATACIGKWHLTNGPDGNYNGLHQAAAHHYGFDVTAKPSPRPDELRTGDKGVDRFTDEAISFIESNKDRPFFCYLPQHTVHRVISAPDPLVNKWAGKGYPATGLNNAKYLASIEHFDAAIGRLVDRIDALGLRDNTAVLFMSDNGGVSRSYAPNPPSNQLSEAGGEFPNGPLRGMKGSAYEGGIRVPLIARWPGVIRPGSVSDTPVHIVDMLPTFFDIAGAKAPSGYTVDGANLTPLLRGRSIPARSLYWYMPFYDLRWGATPSAVIRDGDYKLIEHFGDHVNLDNGMYVPEPRLELFNLRKDLGETANLATREPAKARQLQSKLRAWIAASGAPIPGPNPHHDPSRQLQESRGFAPWQ